MTPNWEMVSEARRFHWYDSKGNTRCGKPFRISVEGQLTPPPQHRCCKACWAIYHGEVVPVEQPVPQYQETWEQPATAFAELREVVGDAYDGIDPVNYVHNLRAGNKPPADDPPDVVADWESNKIELLRGDIGMSEVQDRGDALAQRVAELEGAAGQWERECKKAWDAATTAERRVAELYEELSEDLLIVNDLEPGLPITRGYPKLAAAMRHLVKRAEAAERQVAKAREIIGNYLPEYCALSLFTERVAWLKRARAEIDAAKELQNEG